MYKVLWIDDEHASQRGFTQEAFNAELDLYDSTFDNYEDGLEWLKRNQKECSAVILDVHCKANKNAAANVTSFSNSLEDIWSLCKANNIPWFVYSAGSSQTEDFLLIEKLMLGRKAEWASKNYYDKPNDYELLFEDIQKAISSNPRRQLEKKYNKIFEFVGEAKKENLLNVMLGIANGNMRTTSYMNDMRKVLEWLTTYLIDYGILPVGSGLSDMRHYMVCLNDARLDEIIPKYIRYTMQACENVTQEGSHDGTKDGIQVSKALEAGRAPYLIESTLNNVLTILHWAMLLPTDEVAKSNILDLTQPHVTREIGELKYNEYYDYFHVNDCKIVPYNEDLSELIGRKTIIYKRVPNRGYRRNEYIEPQYFAKRYEITEDLY